MCPSAGNNQKIIAQHPPAIDYMIEMLSPSLSALSSFFIFFFNATATTKIYTLSLHDALPISCEDGRPHDLGLEGLERLLHDAPAQGLLVGGREIGVAERVDDAGRGHDAIRADHHGDGRHGGDLDGGQTCSLELLGDR